MANIHARLAHMGIYVHDRDKMERFYTEVLGLMVTDQGQGRRHASDVHERQSENHHQLVLVTGRPDTRASIRSSRFVHGRFAGRPARSAQRALALGATDMRPVSHGNAWSIYFKDPEGNTVEAYLDTPFHVPQPHGKALDLTKSDEQILRETEAACRQTPASCRSSNSSKRWRPVSAPTAENRLVLARHVPASRRRQNDVRRAATLLFLLRWFDVLAAGATTTRPVRALFIGRPWFLVSAGVLLIVGMTHGLFCMGLLHRNSPLPIGMW